MEAIVLFREHSAKGVTANMEISVLHFENQIALSEILSSPLKRELEGFSQSLSVPISFVNHDCSEYCEWRYFNGFDRSSKGFVSAQKRWDSLCSKGKYLSLLPIEFPAVIQHQSLECT